MPAVNGRFGVMAAVAPQEVQQEPQLRQAAGMLAASGQERRRK